MHFSKPLTWLIRSKFKDSVMSSSKEDSELLSLYISYRDLKSVPVTYFQLFNQLLQSIKTDIVKLMLQRNNCIHFWLLMISSSYSDVLLICQLSVVFQSVSRIWQTVGGPVAHWSLHRVAGLYGGEMCREGKCTGLENLIKLNLHLTFIIYMYLCEYMNMCVCMVHVYVYIYIYIHFFFRNYATFYTIRNSISLKYNFFLHYKCLNESLLNKITDYLPFKNIYIIAKLFLYF